MNRELALLFADFASIAIVFWLTQSIPLAVGLTPVITVETCVA